MTAAYPLVSAAQYLRMSTEHQQYSLENQSTPIQKYAEAHGCEVVCTDSEASHLFEPSSYTMSAGGDGFRIPMNLHIMNFFASQQALRCTIAPRHSRTTAACQARS
jgi:hypothetical protein